MDASQVAYQQQQPQLARHATGSASTATPVFEFTKRKKWDDLLLSELHLTLTLILSLPNPPSPSKILFTGFNTAFGDVLGYKDDELVDSDFANIMHEQDLQMWQSIVNNAILTENDGTIGMFARLKRKASPPPPPSNTPVSPTAPPLADKDVLFEIRGHVHYMQSAAQGQPRGEPACVLANATPYPSPAGDSLNSFLEHKVEHERLVRRVRELQSMGTTPSSHQTSNSSLHHQSPFAQNPLPLSIPQSNSYSTNYPIHPSAGSANLPGEPLLTASPTSGVQSSGLGQYTSSRPMGDHEDDPSARKKTKKGPGQYVCVTCGRTDSPEWRKGPQGPKTLCNACGLRWAKKARKADGHLPDNAGGANPLGIM